MHFRATFLALNDRTVITLDTEFTLFDLIAVAGRVITTYMQLALRIDKVAVHRRAALLAASFGAQRVRFRIVAFQHVQHFVFRHQVNGGFATLFWGKRVAGTTKENAGTGGTNTHLASAGWAINTGQHHLVRTHTAFFRVFLSFIQLLSKISEEVVEYALPFGFVICHLVETVFHLRGKIVVHQFAEVFFQTIGDDFTHFFSIETTVLNANITPILNRRDDRRIRGWATNATFFQLFNQRSFAEARRRFGKVLRWRQFDKRQRIAFIYRR